MDSIVIELYARELMIRKILQRESHYGTSPNGLGKMKALLMRWLTLVKFATKYCPQ